MALIKLSMLKPYEKASSEIYLNPDRIISVIVEEGITVVVTDSQLKSIAVKESPAWIARAIEEADR